MQSTSNAWKETIGCYNALNRPNFVPISFVEVAYTVNDPSAQADATATDNGATDYADTAEITNTDVKTFAKFASCELNRFVLDGTWPIRPNVIEDSTGFVSSVLSDDDCLFSTNPLITISFSQVFSAQIPGISITWSDTYGEMARDFNVRVYDGGTLLHTFAVTDNTSVKTVIESNISGYDKIEIEVVEWCLPYCRARIEEVVVGVVTVFDNSNLMSYTHEQSADMLSFELPDCHIQFEIDNSNDAFNPDNPAGLLQYLIERQQMKVRYGYKLNGTVEWINGGTFYLSGWTMPTNGITAQFTARSLFEFMNAKYTVSTTSLALYDLATDALTQANLPTNADGSDKWNLDNSLQNISVTIASDWNVTLAEVVQLCANAAQCVIRIDRNGNINVEPLNSTLTDYLIDEFVSYKYPEYELSAPLKGVVVNDGQGTAVSGVTGEVQTVSNDLIQNGTVADAVAAWVSSVLVGRKTLSGEFRADPRADALDYVTTQNKYASNTVYLTSIKYTYSGAFNGSYTGRVM